MKKDKFCLYEKTKLPFLVLTAPLPLLMAYNTLPYIVLFTIFYVGLFLVKEWSVKANTLLTMRKVNTLRARAILSYNNILAEVKSKNGLFYFEHNNDYFVINTKESAGKDKNGEISVHCIESIQKITIEDVLEKGIDSATINIIRLLDIKNTFNYRPPTFLRLFYQHATAPFFCFQIFCSLLWCLDEYPYHALFSMVMQVLFEMGIVFTRLKNLREFGQLDLKTSSVGVSDKVEGIESGASMNTDIKNTPVDTLFTKLQGNVTERSYVTKDTVNIYPGDILLIDKPLQVPCDLILLKGECAVNESMLTGESIPLTKDSFTDKLAKRNILYGGTEIIQIKEKIYCYVYRTGFYTEQGNLIKKMMKDTVMTIENKETYLFILVLLFFAMLASSVVIYYNTKSYYKLMLEVIIILTNVVPPELPMEMTLAVNSALQNLLFKKIFCLESFRIPICGKIDVCCFDKTGTLTESDMEVVKIIKYNPEMKEESINDEKELLGHSRHYDTITKLNIGNYDMTDINASISNCHSLLTIPHLTGDPMEKTLFEFLGLNLENDITSDGRHKYVPIVKFAFTSELRRMTSVFTKQGKTYASMKGAPETVRCYLKSVPEGYDSLYKHFSTLGYRIIALAMKPHKKNYARVAVEKDMEFVGFVLYECKIKPQTLNVIKDLKDANCEVVMITGDNLLTAMCVAKKVGILEEKECDNDTVDEIQDKGVEGNEIDNVINSKDFTRYKVFARADPFHKEKIIKKYQSMNKVVLMCGDGTNDVGALKTSDVGVALVKPSAKKTRRSTMEDDKVRLGDASVAAAFTAKTGSISSVLEIIRQGRATLVTTIQMYKILALNSLVSAFSLSFLDILGIRYGDVQMTIAGIIIAFAFAFLTRSKVLKKISKQRPVENIFNKYIIYSVFLQTIVHIASFLLVINNVTNIVYEKEGFGMMSEMFDTKWVDYAIKIKENEQSIPSNNSETPKETENDSKFYPSTLNSTIFILAIAQELNTFIINYIGRPFRESLLENYSLLISLSCCSAVIVGLVFELHTGFSRLMEVVPLPNKTFLFSVIVADFILCYVIEKTCFRLFMMKKK